MMRIRIVGGPGSGKTYLATKLARTFGTPSFKLDTLYYDPDAKERDWAGDPILRDKELQRILKKKQWILEGHWDDWSRPSFDKADQVIILNPSSRKKRIFQRHIKRRLGIIKGKKRIIKRPQVLTCMVKTICTDIETNNILS